MKPDTRLNLSWKLLAAAMLALAGPLHADAPTLSDGTFNGTEDNSVNFNYAQLDNATSANDAENDTITFRVIGISNGTLRKNGSVVSAGGTLANSESWTWEPVANSNGLIAGFTLVANANSQDSPVRTVSFDLTAVNDAPTVSSLGTVTINDDAGDGSTGTKFLSGLTIADVDSPGHNVTLTVTVAKTAEDIGDLSLSGVTPTETGNNLVFKFNNLSITDANARLDEAVFNPLRNALPAGTSQSFAVNVKVEDTGNASLTNQTSGAVTIASVDDLPALTLFFNTTSIADGAPAFPFRLSVNDPDVNANTTQSYTLTLTETAPARGVITIPPGALTGTKGQLEAAIATVRYQPNAQAGTVTASFTCTLTVPDYTPQTQPSSSASLQIVVDNDPPDIAGISSSAIRTDEGVAVRAFPTVIVSDPDAGQSLTATVTPDNTAKGVFFANAAALSAGTSTPTFVTTGNAAAVTQALREVIFRPAVNRVAVGQTETTTLSLAVTDGIVSRSNSLTQVVSQSINGAPDVSVPTTVVPPLTVAGTTSGLPFTLVSITDDDAVSVVTVTLRMDNPAKGTLSTLNGFTPQGGGVFTFTGSPVAAQAAIRLITYTLAPGFQFPAGQPGFTTFTIEASDTLNNRGTLVLSIIMQNAARNHLVTLREDNASLRPGSLRRAIQDALDNDVITFAFASYPAVLRLDAALQTLVLTKHLRFKGPGADLLTISGDSDGNGSPDFRIFDVQSTVVMEGLTLASGSAATGGAVHVGRSSASAPAGRLTLRHCAVIDSTASQWGGAVDVEEGALVMEHCLVKNNATDPSAGLGGGAISLYTSAACSFTATTFSGNKQRAAAGFGGGAIYAENFNPQTIFPVSITHCTFAENEDAAVQGTSIHANVFNCRVTTRGSIFADTMQRNLHVAGSGQILTGGRNVSNDAARTTLLQGGQPQSIVLLNQTSDKVSTDPLLLPLAPAIGGAQVYGLGATSPAIGTLPATEAPDHRGVLRDAAPDSGAVETGITQRVLINEVQNDPAPGAPAFIEFYVPRDSTPVNFADMEVWIAGRLRHKFDTPPAGSPAPPVLQPGYGLILAENGSVTPASAATPVFISDSPSFWEAGQDKLRTVIELRAGGVIVATADVVNVFSNPAVPAQTFVNNSASLAPQFRGHAFVPNSTGQSPPLGPGMARGGPATSPGADTGGTPFGLSNAFPFAAADSFVVNEDDLVSLAVLGNDSDADGLDRLVLVDVSRLTSGAPPTGDDANATSLLNSGVSLTPSAAPLRGTQLWYDPRTALNNLAVGVTAQDSFFYTIVDIGGGPITAYASGGAGVTRITSPAHRLVDTESIVIAGSATAAYNGTFAVTRLNDNEFTILVPFSNDPIARGEWSTIHTRATTQRSENMVTVTVLGRNDAPTPVADTVATTEEQILRIMGDPDLIASVPAFDTDPAYPAPRAFATSSLLANDTDPDDDDVPFRKLRIVGVAAAKAVTNYAGTAGQSPVTVTVPGHGFTTGAQVLLSGYGGHASYNSTHTVTVLTADTFTIPVPFVENHPQKGLAGVIAGLQTTSTLGAAVTLEIRSNRAETNIVYNPRTSATLNMLSRNEPAADSFYYVTQDTHNGQAFAKVTVNVTGVNDAPVPQHDPAGVSGLVSGGASLRDVLAGAKVLYSVPSATANRGTVTLQADGANYVLTDVPRTNEETVLYIPEAELLGNDSDIDHLDTLRVTLPAAGQNVSREGAAVNLAVSLIDGSRSVHYDPRLSPRLNALAREERVMDSIALNIFDGTTSVTAIVAIEVTGRNDKPTALADSKTIPEDQLLTLAPPAVLINDSDPDQDTRLPDNRKVILPATDVPTNVFGARINASVAAASGTIASFEAAAGNAALTKVNAAGHGLNTGEEIRIGGTAVDAYNGQFPITRLDDNSFTIPVPSTAGAATAGSGSWESLRSTVTYDPRGSVFNGSPVGTTFTLDGLAQGQTFMDAWTYTMTDGSMVFANDDMFRVESDSAGVVLDVFANDANLTGLTGALNIIAVGTPSQRGTAGIGDNNTITYTPETNFAGDEYFTYTVVDGQGNTDTALVTVRVTIEQLNGNLQANRDAFTVAKGQSPLLAVLANDDLIPATGAALSITQISTAPNAGGTAVIEAGGIRYTPAATRPAYPYAETFAYEISGGGTARAVATVNIMVANRENTLALRADTVSVPAGSSNNVLNVLANDNILPGSGLDLVITAASTSNGGSVQITPDSKRLLFTPNAGFLGTSSFTYTASDALGGTGTASVSVTVGGLTTNNDFFTVPSTAATPVTLDVLANDRVLGSPGNISIKPMPENVTPIGTLSAVSAGAQILTFTPVAGQTGEHTFTYRIVDGTGREAAGSVTVFVSGPGLLANSDFFTVQAGSQSNALNVLLNDVQIPDLGQPKSIVGTGTGGDAPDQGGTVTVNPGSTALLYTPGEGFSGEERFTYSVTNGDVTVVAQVIVRVTDGALIAADDAFSVFKGSSAMRLEVLSNDRVIPSSGQTLSITGIGIVNNAPGRQGTVTVTSDAGALLYTPNDSNTTYPYTETFTYEISDGTARRAQGTVTMEVLDRAGAREMETNDDAFTILASTQNVLLAVLANDDIRPASASGWLITGLGPRSQGGAAAVSGNGISYTPAAGFVGTDTFNYTVTDGLGGTGTALVTVKVGDISVSDDVFTVLSGSGNTALKVLANDGTLPGGFPDRSGIPGLTGFTLATSPAITPNRGGTAVVSGGMILYRPAANFTGEETFTYLVKDDSGITFPGLVTVSVEPAGSDRASAVLNITVTGVNDAPVYVNPAATATNDRTALHPFANATIIDVDDQQRQHVTVRVTWPAGQGLLSGGFCSVSPGVIEFSGRPSEVTTALRGLVFTPFNNRIPVGTTETTVFGVTLDDGFVTSPVSVDGISTTVTPANDPPVLTGTVAGQKLQKAFTLQPFIGTNITDVDNLGLQSLRVSVQIDSAMKGTLTGAFLEQSAGSGNYTFTGTPAAAAAALRALVFTPTPGGRITPSQSETATFTITVNDSFAAPLVNAATSVIVVHGEQDVILPLNQSGQDFSQNGAEFSTGLALSGDTLVVGSPRRDTAAGVDAGAAYVYERNAGAGLPWGQVAVLQPAEVNPSDFFGYSAAIDGDLLAVGAPFSESAGLQANAGVVYVFKRDPSDRNAWLQLARLTAVPGATVSNENFGWSVALHGTTLLVAAPRASLGGQPGVGRVFVFERNQAGPDGFTSVQTLSASDGRSGHNFGTSVALDGNAAVIGAEGASRSFAADDLELGAAYVFQRPAPGGTWAESLKLSAFADPDARAGDHFGHSVDIDGDSVIIGAPQFDPVLGGTRRIDGGSVFLFARNHGDPGAWTLSAKIASPDAQAGDYYGDAVAIAGDLAFAGAPKAAIPASNNGFVDLLRRHTTGPSGWIYADRFLDGPGTGFDRFGRAVALDSFTGAAGSSADTSNAGQARAYQFNFDHGPRLATPLPDQRAPENLAFTYQVPGDAFGDPEFGGALTYTAILENGSPLPAGGWLAFDAVARTFSGTPVPGNNDDYRLIVRAVNQLGAVAASNAFTIGVALDPAGTLERIYSQWAAGRFPADTLANPSLENTVWGMNANPDRDSALNLVEMVFDTLPQSVEPSPLVVVKNPDATVSVTFPRNPAVPLEFIHVEWGDNLGSWERCNVGYTTFTGQDGREYITATVYPDAPRHAIFIRVAGGM